MVKNQKEIIGAFLAEKMGNALTDDVLKVINQAVTLEEGDSNEANETRSVKIKEDAEGKVTAASIKLYNILKISFADWADLLVSVAGAFINNNTNVTIAYAILQLISTFGKKLSYDFSEFDAKVLLKIYEHKQAGNQQFQAADLTLTPSVSLENIEKSLAFLKEMRVLKYWGNQTYTLKESINYERT